MKGENTIEEEYRSQESGVNQSGIQTHDAIVDRAHLRSRAPYLNPFIHPPFG